MWAVLSDIHGNLEALDAVLADIAKLAVSRVFCLGDLVGYGPNPVKCVERAMRCDLTLLGNFDQGVMLDLATGAFPPSLKRSLGWSQSALNCRHPNPLRAFLASLHRTHTEGHYLLVHGSPRNPLNEYVFPEDVHNTDKFAKIGALMDRYCLCGHTHVPGVFIEPESGQGAWEYLSTEECFGFCRLNGRKTIVNVGSVGQPRDGDWRACYVLVDGWDIAFRRVEYDVERTVQKIYAIHELENFYGDRLREGR